MKKVSDVAPEKSITSALPKTTTEQIPRFLIIGVMALFIVFLITSVVLALWLPEFAWIPLVLFLLVFILTAVIYFFTRINSSIANKKEEDIKALRKNEAGLLELIKIKIGDTINKQSEGHHG